MMSWTEICEVIQSREPDLRRMGVKKISLFGSWAKRRATEQSDIDLLVELHDEAHLKTIVEYLEHLLGYKVDLVEVKHLQPPWKDEIQQTALSVF